MLWPQLSKCFSVGSKQDMNFNTAKDLVKNVSTENWLTDIELDGTFVIWLPVLTLVFDTAPPRLIGLSNNGFWVTQYYNGKIKSIDTRNSCFHLLFCLEKDRIEFENTLKTNLLKCTLEVDLVNTFPYSELIKMTLLTDTHWAEKAAFWLQEYDMDPELADILNLFLDNKKHSQNARHQTFKLLKRWQNIQ